MKYYATKDGYLIHHGTIQENELPIIEGCKVFEGDIPENIKPPPRAEMPYNGKRFHAYPPIGDQLDCFWHAMDSGAMQKIEPFYSQIKAVKEKYPKP